MDNQNKKTASARSGADRTRDTIKRDATPPPTPQKNTHWGRVDTLIDLAFLLTILIAMSISRPVQSLYWDDLSYFSVYHSTSVLGFLFNTFGDKFRPVANVILWLCYSLTGGGGRDLYFLLLLVNLLAVVTVYFIGRQIGKNRYIGLLTGVLYTLSRCSYYQLNQVFGIMEACATLFSVLSLFFMYKFICQKSGITLKPLLFASLFTVLTSFSHERFIVLYFMLFLAALINLPQKKWPRIVALGLPVVLCLLNLAVRSALMSQPFAGTGGVNIAQSLDVLQFLKFFLIGLTSLFGFNTGEAYLFGINELEILRGYPFTGAQVFAVLALLFALAAFGLVLKAFGRVLRYQDKTEKQTALKTFLLFVLFIGVTLACGCITIRLELRWLYVPYAGCLLLLAYSTGILLRPQDASDKRSNRLRWTAGLLAVLVLSAIPLEIFYRMYVHRIAYVGQQVISNQFYSQTVEKYGTELYSHPIVILSPDGEASGFSQSYFDTFFNEYSFELFPDDVQRPTARVYFIVSVQDMEALEGGSLVHSQPYIYSFTPDNRGVYTVSEITDLILPMLQKESLGQTLRTALLEEGVYAWEGDFGWVHTEQVATLKMRTGTNHSLTLTANTYDMNLPNVLRIYFDDQLIVEKPLTTTDASFTIQSDLIPEDTVGTLKLELERITSDYEANGGADRRPIGLTISDLVFD